MATTDRPLQRTRGHDEDVIVAAVCDCCRRIILIFYSIITRHLRHTVAFHNSDRKAFTVYFGISWVSNAEMNRAAV